MLHRAVQPPCVNALPGCSVRPQTVLDATIRLAYFPCI